MSHDTFPVAEKGETQTDHLEAETYPDLVASYETFKSHLQPKADVIYHPCCAVDVSPSEVFPNSHIIYADLDENAMNALTKAGYDAHTADVLTFNPGDVDILFLLNPAISPVIPSSFVVGDGYIVTNDYHRTADQLHASDEYEVKAIIKKMDGRTVFDDVDPEGYWQEVENEEEFQRASGSMNAVNYAKAKEIVEHMTGRTENILNEYKALVQAAQEKDLQERHELWAQTPDKETLASFGITPDVLATIPEQPEPQVDPTGPWQIEDPTGRMILLTPLPRRNGREEDIFIFRKKPTNYPDAQSA